MAKGTSRLIADLPYPHKRAIQKKAFDEQTSVKALLVEWIEEKCEKELKEVSEDGSQS